MARKPAIDEKNVQAQVAKQGFPEKGSLEQADLKKFYKHLSDEQLAEWMELEGLEHKPSESAPINRMRMAMAILYHWFPKAPAQKKKAKYADYTNEQLAEMALEHDVDVEPTEDPKILRMRTIMALRSAGHLA